LASGDDEGTLHVIEIPKNLNKIKRNEVNKSNKYIILMKIKQSQQYYPNCYLINYYIINIVIFFQIILLIYRKV